jgi:hypothetical protein
MNKVIQLIVVFILLTFTFFMGVNYAESVKTKFGWIFESKEQEIPLPDLSDEPQPPLGSMENSEQIDNPVVEQESPNTSQDAVSAPSNK